VKLVPITASLPLLNRFGDEIVAERAVLGAFLGAVCGSGSQKLVCGVWNSRHGG
jgi:hypothetical protein